MTRTPFSICVYCGSRNGNDPAYLAAATALGQVIAEQGWRLVFGAGDVGMMGAVADAATSAGAATLGVIPTHLLDVEAPRRLNGDRIITETMHERKKVMFMNSDAVVVLPGGAGSLDEFFEVLTWAQIGLHQKPLFLLDVNGYWQPLVQLIDHVIARGFAGESLKGQFRTVKTVEELTASLKFAASVG